MKKTTITLAIALMAGGAAQARTLSPAEALGRALSAADAPDVVSAMRAPARVTPALTVSVSEAQAQTPALYVINTSESGYVIVSADDVAAPLLGYSDEGAFDPENMPTNMRAWLDNYRDEIAYAIESGMDPYVETAAAPKEAIAPKCTTRWDQGYPYNAKCPKVGNTLTYTGCVATAMAQVINYRKYPTQGKGTHSYSWSGRTLTFNYGATTFDWANMLDRYNGVPTEAQIDAVATLMYACGVGVDMGYGTGSSGAVSSRVPGAMREYFDFDNGVHFVNRMCYTSQEWADMIYDEIAANGPTYYSGRGEEGGHAFVADGYLDGYYHFNWGWGGMSDGYFKLNALTPGSQGIGGGSNGYNQDQGAILGCKPAVAGSPMAAPYLCTNQPIHGYATSSGIRVTGPFYNYTPYDINGRFGLELRDEAGNVVCTQRSVSGRMSQGTILQYFEASKYGIPAGTYKAYPVYVQDGVNYPVHLYTLDMGYLIVTADGNNVTVEAPLGGELQFTSCTLVSPMYANKIFAFDLPYTYNGDKDVLLPVVPMLMNSLGEVVSTGEEYNAIINPGGGTMQYAGMWYTSQPEAGVYTVIFTTPGGLNSYGGSLSLELCSPVEVTVLPAITGSTLVRVNNADWSIDNADNVNPELITFHATINCLMGYYAGPIFARICEVGETNPLTQIASENLFFSKGEKPEVTFSGEFLGSTPGKTYDVYLYNMMGAKLTSAAKKITITTESGIADINAADANAPVEYYNLQGQRIDNPQAGQLVIRRQGGNVVKMIAK